MGRLVRRYIQTHRQHILQNNRGNIAAAGTYGLLIEANLLGTITNAGDTYGLEVALYAEAGITHTGHIISLYVTNYMLKQPTPGDYFMLWMQENGSVTIKAWIHCHQGGTSNSTYWLSITGVADAWASAGSKVGGGASGWLAVNTPGGVRYIQLYA